jgi:RimJ/RimL family protein N-acetyltransferase
MIVFRRLQRGDLAFLLEVRNQSRDMLHDNSVFTLEQAQVWFDTQQPRFYLATQDARPVGYFRTSNWDEANSHAYVGFDLHPDFRGKGLAQSAYRVFLTYLFTECGLNKVSMEVLEHNHPARRLYERIGFKQEGVKREEIHRNGRYIDSIMLSMLKSEFHSRYS